MGRRNDFLRRRNRLVISSFRSFLGGRALVSFPKFSAVAKKESSQKMSGIFFWGSQKVRNILLGTHVSRTKNVMPLRQKKNKSPTASCDFFLGTKIFLRSSQNVAVSSGARPEAAKGFFGTREKKSLFCCSKRSPLLHLSLKGHYAKKEAEKKKENLEKQTRIAKFVRTT